MSDSSGPLIFELLKEIGILNQLSTARFTKALAPELNPSEFGVLNHFVTRGDGKTPSYLAKAFQMTKPSMTAILGKLSAKGYVAIEGGEADRRQKFASITQAGRAARARGLAAADPLMQEIEAGFDTAKLAQILPVLQALREFLDNARNSEDGLT